MVIRCLIIAFSLAIALPASATTFNVVRFGTGGLGASICAPPGSGREITSANPLFEEINTHSDTGHCQQSSVLRSGGGSVGVSARMQADPDAGLPRVNLTARSTFDLMLGVPSGWSGGLIPISLTGFLEADLSATVLSGSQYGRFSTAQLRAVVELGGFASTSGIARAKSVNLEHYIAHATSPYGTPFANLIVAEEIGTDIINVDPRRAITVAFELNASVSGTLYSDAAMTSDVLALNSLGFLPGATIFDLPAGFTLDAPDFGIVGNRYGAAPSAVPLPGAGLLLLGGFAVLAGLRRR